MTHRILSMSCTVGKSLETAAAAGCEQLSQSLRFQLERVKLAVGWELLRQERIGCSILDIFFVLFDANRCVACFQHSPSDYFNKNGRGKLE